MRLEASPPARTCLRKPVNWTEMMMMVTKAAAAAETAAAAGEELHVQND